MKESLILIIILFIQSHVALRDCLNDTRTIEDDISGDWYEIMRSPEIDVPECTRVMLNKTEDNATLLKLNYVNNINKNWQYVEKNLKFPWSNATKPNTLELKFGEGKDQVTVTFKFLELYKESFLIVCGSAPSVSAINLMKVLSRHRHVNESVNQDLEKHLEQEYDIRHSQVGLVYQGEDCNRSVRHLSYHVILTILFNKIFTEILNC